MSLGDGLLHLFERRGQVRAHQLGQRLAGLILVRGPAHRGVLLAGRRDESAGVLFGGDHDERATEQLVFLLLSRPCCPVERRFVLVSSDTNKAAPASRARSNAVR
ncbi:MAG: hypothetical protein ACLP01_00475, partial [Solirubrobacteraceae bacterium]